MNENELFVLDGMPGVDEEDDFKRLVAEAELEESALHLPRGYLSVSQVSMYLRCGMQYKFRYVDELIRPPGVALVEGSAMHKALEVGLREKMTSGKVAPLDVMLDAWQDTWKEKKKEVVDWGESSNETERTVETRAQALVGKYHAEHLPQRNPAGVEQRFWTMIGETRTPVLGYIDLVDLETVSGIPGSTVVDHKVVRAAKSQAETDSDIQLTIYAYVTKTPRVGFDSFCKTKKPQIKTTRSLRTLQDFKWATYIFDTVAQNISKGFFMPTNPANWVCSPKFCGYYDICRGRKR